MLNSMYQLWILGALDNTGGSHWLLLEKNKKKPEMNQLPLSLWGFQDAFSTGLNQNVTVFRHHGFLADFIISVVKQ